MDVWHNVNGKVVGNCVFNEACEENVNILFGLNLLSSGSDEWSH